MALKRTPKEPRKKAAASPVEEKQYFWGEEEVMASVSEDKKKLSDQISRLQQRQMELVQQTATELEDLKRQLENDQASAAQIAKARQPLEREVRQLRGALAELEEQKKALFAQLTETRKEFRDHHAKMQGALNSLKNAIRGQARTFDQQVRVFSLDASQSIESMLSAAESAALPIPEDIESVVSLPEVAIPAHANLEIPAEEPEPDPQPAVFARHEAVLAQRAPKIKPVREKRPFAYRKFAVRTITVALVAAGSLAGVRYIEANQRAAVLSTVQQNGQVAGASSSKLESIQAPVDQPVEQQYTESKVDLPFAATEWERTNDSEFKVAFEYPKNTSNLVRTIGGSNLWVLRKDGYLLRVKRTETTQDLDTWWSENSASFRGYTGEKSTLNGEDAWKLTVSDEVAIPGSQYLVKSGNQILEIWVKDEPKDSDDGKRIQHMLESLELTGN